MPIRVRIVGNDITLTEVLQSVFKLQFLPEQLCFDPFGFLETIISFTSIDRRLPGAKGAILTEKCNLLALCFSTGCHSILEGF